jgi:TRAP-type mannitol/chloroaromatic compound transport system permease large subunit
MNTIFRGVLPFIAWDVLRIGLLLLFPAISLIALRLFS